MTDDAFFEFLDACREQLQAKQERFMNELPKDTYWQYDLDAQVLAIAGTEFPITVIGSFRKASENEESSTWLWAWANETFSDEVRDQSAKIKSLYELTKFKVFDEPGLEGTSAEAQDLSAMAIHQLEAIGLFRAPSDDVTLFFAVHSIES